MQLIGIDYSVDKLTDTIKRTQEITDDFLTQCNDNRIASMHAPMGDWHEVASVPVVIVEKWLREGFDIYKEPLKATMQRLRNEDLSAFITTDKRLF
jgi:hypothetical protein